MTRCHFDLKRMPTQLWLAFKIHCRRQSVPAAKQLRHLVEAWLKGAIHGMPRIVDWVPACDAMLGIHIISLKKHWERAHTFTQYTRVTTTPKLRDDLSLRARLFGIPTWKILNALVYWFLIRNGRVHRYCLLKTKQINLLRADNFRVAREKKRLLLLEKSGQPDKEIAQTAFPGVYAHQLRENSKR